MRPINVFELKKYINKKNDFQIIDIQKPDEYAVSIFMVLYPLPFEIFKENTNKINKIGTAIIYCNYNSNSVLII
jgi:hypothetical protein